MPRVADANRSARSEEGLVLAEAKTRNIVRDLEHLAFPVEKLAPLPGNPRRGDVEVVARSYATFGQRKPIVARRERDGGIVIAGNHQLAAAKQPGWTHIAVVWVDDDDITAKAFALADNRTADLGTYDETDLLAMLQAVHDADAGLFQATAYDDEALAALVASLEPDMTTPRRDTDPGDLPAEPITKPGDLILLGEHRLLCGDSTSAKDVERLLDETTVDLIMTDPPYGLQYVGKTADALTVQNDALGEEDTRQLIAEAFTICGLKAGGAFYVCAPPGDKELAFRLGLIDAGLPMRHSIVWVKQQFVFGRSDFHYRHESILYGWREGAAHYFVNDRTQDSVWEYDRPHASKDHPTVKPIELFEKAITNSSRFGETCFDCSPAPEGDSEGDCSFGLGGDSHSPGRGRATLVARKRILTG